MAVRFRKLLLPRRDVPEANHPRALRRMPHLFICILSLASIVPFWGPLRQIYTSVT